MSRVYPQRWRREGRGARLNGGERTEAHRGKVLAVSEADKAVVSGLITFDKSGKKRVTPMGKWAKDAIFRTVHPNS